MVSVKDSDGWMELAHELKFEKFKNEHPDIVERYEKFEGRQ